MVGGLTKELYHSDKISSDEEVNIKTAVKDAWKNAESRETLLNIFKEELLKVKNQEETSDYIKRAEDLFENETMFSNNKEKNELFVKNLVGTGFMGGGLTKELYHGDKITNNERVDIQDPVQNAWKNGESRETLLNIFKEGLLKVKNQEETSQYIKRAEELFENENIFSENKEKNEAFVEYLVGTGFNYSGMINEMPIRVFDGEDLHTKVMNAWKNGADGETLLDIFKKYVRELKYIKPEDIDHYISKADEIFEMTNSENIPQ